MATKLKNLKVKKVDFVDEGANPDAHIKLFKRKEKEGQSKKDNLQLSLGTVYRNLQQLSDNGEINRLSIPNQPDRFDGVIEEHYHAVCEKCVTIYDIHINEMFDIDSLVAEKTGLDITGHEIIFKTICPMCKN